MSREADEKFHAELSKYLRGEPNEIRSGTIGMTWAEIAKRLVENDPELLLPENKEKLRSEIDAIYDREHAVRVTLTPEQIAAGVMSVTHEDDLPSA